MYNPAKKSLKIPVLGETPSCSAGSMQSCYTIKLKTTLCMQSSMHPGIWHKSQAGSWVFSSWTGIHCCSILCLQFMLLEVTTTTYRGSKKSAQLFLYTSSVLQYQLLTTTLPKLFTEIQWSLTDKQFITRHQNYSLICLSIILRSVLVKEARSDCFKFLSKLSEMLVSELRKLVFFLIPLVNFTTEKCTVWKILMECGYSYGNHNYKAYIPTVRYRQVQNI